MLIWVSKATSQLNGLALLADTDKGDNSANNHLFFIIHMLCLIHMERNIYFRLK